jgi:hypothetical protein
VTSKSTLLVPFNQPGESLKKYGNETDNIRLSDESEFESLYGQQFSSPTSSRPVLWPTGSSFAGVKRPGHEADH